MCDFEQFAPCPECGGDGGFEEAGSGKWSVCTFCDGSGDVETEAASGLCDLEDRCPYRMFTEEEEAGWERIFAGIFCPKCDAHLPTSPAHQCNAL